jgi:predicted dehydrogenase
MIGYVRRFDPSYRDAHDKIRAGAIGRPFLARSQTADQNDASGFFVRYAGASGGILLDMSVHDIDTVRWLLGAGGAKRVFATGTIAVHEGLRDVGDVDNAVATIEFEGGEIATIYASRTMAHGHETLTEIVGTAGRLTVRQNPPESIASRSPTGTARNECTPTFYERFADAFPQEAQRSSTSCAETPAAADARRRHRGNAHRHRRHRIAALAADGRALTPWAGARSASCRAPDLLRHPRVLRILRIEPRSSSRSPASSRLPDWA